MSRREFRASVSDARPASAWLLVSVASAMLWITEQLAAPVVVLQALGIVFSLLRRRNPQPWQNSPIALNAGMFAIVAITIAMALRGHPSTVVLAHFAAPAQALQLLDTRPRKSEFLLVTLALFQVILASTLTDSLLFPPLLAVFVVATVWTLMVHTLRTEAIESGDGTAISGALTPGLKRMTAVAAACSILLALGIFLLLPRMRTSMLRAGLGAAQAVSGFSDRVALGALGRIRMDRSVILRIETLEGEPPAPSQAYWRGLSFDAFDGREWSITPADRTPRPGSTKFGIELAYGEAPPDLVQRIVREPVEAGVLFSPGLARRISGSLQRVYSDVNGGLYAPGRVDRRVRYTISAATALPDPKLLRRDRARPPAARGQRYLGLPEFDHQVRNLAQNIVRGASTDSDRARAIEGYLRRNGQYTDTPPSMDNQEDRSPVEQFILGDLAGHCEYFASAMVVLARSLGLPSRLVNGFAGGRENPLGGFVEVAGSDAHAWVEIHYEQAGWVRYDPTPPDLRLRTVGALSFRERLAALGSTIELWWFQRVVDFDSSDQVAALRAAFGAWRWLRAPDRHTEPGRGSGSGLSSWHPDHVSPWDALLLAILIALAAELVRRHRRREHALALPATYAQSLRLLARRRLTRGAMTTARDFARQVGEALPPEAGRAFGNLTEAYLCERFGVAPPASGSADLETLRSYLGRRRSWESARRSAHSRSDCLV
jgi:transglutaminase-like putative cysteine protease